MEFSEKIKALRKKENWTQAELAKKINISNQAVSKWETGRGFPDIANLIQIGDLFNLTLDELVRDDLLLQKKMSQKNKNWLMLAYFLLLIVGFLLITFSSRAGQILWFPRIIGLIAFIESIHLLYRNK
ncbi:helix-turn-helix domain-containing protein [Isobaculum melis]|uniref:Helix-turn-helix n=1 Tax=Isobaculum melis TaxID=142588 RepID=A0A1H9UCU2_9LACT|nr:helix-turn-helix transcriptional regulator [Isobaculum melis]SES07390.1 Helix-turn-helix [Isobaculum melis]